MKAVAALLSTIAAAAVAPSLAHAQSQSYFEHIVNDKNDCGSKPMVGLFSYFDGACTSNFIAPTTCTQAIYNETSGAQVYTEPYHLATCQSMGGSVKSLDAHVDMLQSSGKDYLRLTGYADQECKNLWFQTYYRLDGGYTEKSPMCARMILQVYVCSFIVLFIVKA